MEKQSLAKDLEGRKAEVEGNLAQQKILEEQLRKQRAETDRILEAMEEAKRKEGELAAKLAIETEAKERAKERNRLAERENQRKLAELENQKKHIEERQLQLAQDAAELERKAGRIALNQQEVEKTRELLEQEKNTWRNDAENLQDSIEKKQQELENDRSAFLKQKELHQSKQIRTAEQIEHERI